MNSKILTEKQRKHRNAYSLRYMKEYKKAHPEKVKTWYENQRAHREKYHAEYRKSHKEQANRNNKRRKDKRHSGIYRYPVSDKKRNLRLRHAGLTLEEYDRMVSIQNNVCFICGRTTIKGRSLAVDHNHVTGKIRKLLCDLCNRGLGYFKENITIMEKAIQYIKDHQ